MNTVITLDQQRDHEMLVASWNDCTHFGTISSGVDRINDVPSHLANLGVTDLIFYLWINERLKGFVYKANLSWKNPIHVVETYHDLCPRSTEWREQDACLALQLDADLADGLDEGIVVTDFVVPFYETAHREVMLNYMSDDLRQTILSRIPEWR